MKEIHDRALELSGLTYDRAFAIDDVNLIAMEKEGCQEEWLFDLTEDFFERIFADEEDNTVPKEFRCHYQNKYEDSDELSNNYSDWMVQRLGGEDFYSNRRGLPALLARHSNINITTELAEMWLAYMRKAMDFVESEKKIKKLPRNMIEDHLRYCAYYLVAGSELTRMQLATGRQDFEDLSKTFAELKSESSACPFLDVDDKPKIEAVAAALPVEKAKYKGDEKVFAKFNDKMRRGVLSGVRPSEYRTWLYLLTVDANDPVWIEEVDIKTTLK